MAHRPTEPRCIRAGEVSTEETPHSIFYNGFWLDKRYWEGTNIKQTFTFDDSLLPENNLKYKQMIEESDSVAIHVRRGDYQSPLYKASFGDFCTIEYYLSAISTVREKGGAALRFFVFSDDMAWARNNLGLDNAVYVKATPATTVGPTCI